MGYVRIRIYADFTLSIHKAFWALSVFHRFTNHYASSSL